MPLPLWLSALVFLVQYWVQHKIKLTKLAWILSLKHLVRCPFAVWRVKLTAFIFARLTILLFDLCYGNVLMIRNWQWIPLLRYFFGLHWCLYRCYRWCRRSLGLLHQLEGFRQRYCFRRPRNLCSWYKIIRVQPPPKKSKRTRREFCCWFIELPLSGQPIFSPGIENNLLNLH